MKIITLFDIDDNKTKVKDVKACKAIEDAMRMLNQCGIKVIESRQMSDSITTMKEARDVISREVDHEYHEQDAYNYTEEYYGSEFAENVTKEYNNFYSDVADYFERRYEIGFDEEEVFREAIDDVIKERAIEVPN